MRPFDRYKSDCIKCGAVNASVQWHSAVGENVGSRNCTNEEHMHRTCRICEYEWEELPLDAESAT